jgi:hypothetical protein
MPAKKQKIASRTKNRQINHKSVAKKTTQNVAKNPAAKLRGKKIEPIGAAEPSVTIYEIVETELFAEPELAVEDEEEAFGT